MGGTGLSTPFFADPKLLWGGPLFFTGPKMLRGGLGDQDDLPYIIPLKIRVFGEEGVYYSDPFTNPTGHFQRFWDSLSLPIKFTIRICFSRRQGFINSTGKLTRPHG